MPERKVLITGASGEIGQALIQSLDQDGQSELVTLDLKPLPESVAGKTQHIVGDLLDKGLLSQLESEHKFSHIFHLAAVLSTTAEKQPFLAHQVNTCATFDLLNLAARQSQQTEIPVIFMFPSSIAVYGLPDLETKNSLRAISEDQFTEPTTMYGCSKLYCEKAGIYFSSYYQQLAEETPVRLDFRAIRFPGIISAFTIPSGGTSDFGPEMIHAAAKGEPYECFVRSDVRIPFMVMPDAVHSLLTLAEASGESLSQRVYNITSFSLSAGEFRDLALQGFPDAQIKFNPDPRRQAIVDSWPADVDDSPARRDWNWEPRYPVDNACQNYLMENITRHYA